MESNWEEFYANQPKPSDLETSTKLLDNFVKRYSSDDTKIALVTSGGTTVPLEHNTVRFVDNFSAGTRGAISTEYFLKHGYAVIFMYRAKSLEPFSRHFTGQKFLDMLDLTQKDGRPQLTVCDKYSSSVAEALVKYKSAIREGKLLQLSFTTLSEYLWLLRAASQAVAPLKKRVVLYLAAAVSDFYVPSNEMSVHKIGSTIGAPKIALHLVPKILKPLVSLWVPEAFVVSFKLETDENLLISKARASLNTYNHKLVIANMLQTRKQKVTMVDKDKDYVLSLTKDQMDQGEEIESSIITDLVKRHQNFLSPNDSS
ncbi:phosphopantothenate--cysteine ligase [Diachasmimorpha longicaudata]|uniref:phosphopantothenate--cysteine ligase n=1 Tax=Diachasmimorpha longicaudata TaxID=58733 RepID=UPI0030B8E3A0